MAARGARQPGSGQSKKRQRRAKFALQGSKDVLTDMILVYRSLLGEKQVLRVARWFAITTTI